jgi:amidohydrolase
VPTEPWIDALRAAVRAELPAAASLRHDLHCHPELSGSEAATAERVRRVLGPLTGHQVAGTGLLARIGRQDGPAVAVRAELDALPVTEKTGVPWSASGPRMHACGHDVHLAALTALGRAMSRVDTEVPAAMLAVFQPREEANPSGALDVMSAPEWKRHEVRAVIGAHVQPLLGPGVVAATPGPINAAVCNIGITVTGSGGHAAYPHVTQDPVLAISEIVLSLQQVVSRRISPVHAAVLSIGELRAGSAPGVIPPSAYAAGTLRALDPADMVTLRDAAAEVTHAVARAHRCEASVSFEAGEPVLANDERLVADTRERLTRFGVTLAPELRSCGADDFSYYAQAHPGLMMFVGTTNIGTKSTGQAGAVSLHQPTFCPADDAIADVAQALLAGFVSGARGVLPPGLPVLVRDRLGQRRPPGRRREGVGEVLGLVRDRIAGEFHHAHRVGGRAVVADHDLADPQVAAAPDPQHAEVPLGRMPAALRLDLRPAPEALAGLRVVQDPVGRVDRVLGVAVPALRSRPVLRYPGAGRDVIHSPVHLQPRRSGSLVGPVPSQGTGQGLHGRERLTPGATVAE